MSKNDRYYLPFWEISFLSIGSFSIVEGLRFGRAADYFSYKDIFENPTVLVNSEIEPLFKLFCQFLQFFHIPSVYGFLFSSFLLILSCFIFLRKRRAIALFAIPIFYLEVLTQSENLVRQYWALSFLLIAMAYLERGKYHIFFLLLVSACLSHTSLLFLMPFIIIFHLFKNPFRNLGIIITLYIISVFLVPESELIFKYVQRFEGFGTYENYLEKAEYWFSGDVELREYSVFFFLRIYLRPLIVLGLGYSLLKRYEGKYLYLFYHLYYVGVLAGPASRNIPTELLVRVNLNFTFFGFIIVSYILYDHHKRFNELSRIRKVGYILLLSDSLYMLIKTTYTFNESLGCLFIWDKTF